MLSRVADSLCWMGRYVERAENLARLVDVSHHASLDYYASEVGQEHGKRLINATDCLADYELACEEAGEELDVNAFIMYSVHNPNSVVQCINHARENARMVRDQLSESVWLELNRIHLSLKEMDLPGVWNEEPQELLQEIIRFSLLFQGLTYATNLHDEGWDFVELGRFLERADKSSRVLDVLTFQENPTRADIASVLNSCSGFSAYYHQFKGQISMDNVIMFLLASPKFPRSVRFCLRQVDELLHSISGVPTGQFSNEAERITGKLLAQLNFMSQEDIQRVGLHDYIDQIQIDLNLIGQHIFENFVRLPAELDDVNLIRQPGKSFQQQWQRQWEQQQQQ